MHEPIPLAGDRGPFTRPALPGAVVVRESADEVIDAALADLFMHALACARAFGDFHLALSGGGTPMPMYRRLMYDPAYREFPWTRTHLWIVDERRVPFDDDRSNFRHIDEIIGHHSGIPREQVHPIRATEPDADAAYERLLRDTLEWREKGQDRLDYVLLGMGADAHTASLFPRSPALRPAPGGPQWVRINAGPSVTPPDRVTMTYQLINAARFIAVLATGAAKRPTIARVAAAASLSPPPIDDLPILGVRPVAGELRWYLDAEACPE